MSYNFSMGLRSQDEIDAINLQAENYLIQRANEVYIEYGLRMDMSREGREFFPPPTNEYFAADDSRIIHAAKGASATPDLPAYSLTLNSGLDAVVAPLSSADIDLATSIVMEMIGHKDPIDHAHGLTGATHGVLGLLFMGGPVVSDVVPETNDPLQVLYQVTPNPFQTGRPPLGKLILPPEDQS